MKTIILKPKFKCIVQGEQQSAEAYAEKLEAFAKEVHAITGLSYIAPIMTSSSDGRMTAMFHWSENQETNQVVWEKVVREMARFLPTTLEDSIISEITQDLTDRYNRPSEK